MNKNYEKWCEQLLDTGKGNRLINFKESKQRSLEILYPEMNKLFDLVISGKPVQFFDFPNNNDLDNESNETLSKQYIIDCFSKSVHDNMVLPYKKDISTSSVLKNLKKVSNTMINEKGINTLYIAFGFLNWKESENSNIIFKSPLILLPIQLENSSLMSPFYMKLFDDDIKLNPTLVYKLKTEYGIELPQFRDGEGNADEKLNDYLDNLSNYVEQYGWKINKDIFVSIFSFLKLNMYVDLKENEKKILSNRIIKSLIDGKNELINDNEFDIDKLFNEGDEINLHNVVDADSSQLEAIYKAKRGQSFVLQGPPGTGKSQTITNMIAELLFAGKKVLFVSEKPSALNIVYNNLKKVNLNDFCLELHSHKTNKKDFIEDLSKMTDYQSKILNSSKFFIDDLKKAKQTLDNYASTINQKQDIINKTPYQIIGEVEKFEKYSGIDFIINHIEDKDRIYLNNVLEQIKLYIKYSEIIGRDYKNNIWSGLSNKESSYQQKITFKKLIPKVLNFIEDIDKLWSQIVKLSNNNIILNSCSDLEEFMAIIDRLVLLKTFNGNYFDEKQQFKLLSKVKEYNKNKAILLQNKNELQTLFKGDFFELNAKKYYNRFKNEYSSIFSRWFGSDYKKDKKMIVGYLINYNKKISYNQLIDYISKLKLVQDFEKDIDIKTDELLSLMKPPIDYTQQLNWQQIEDDLTKLQGLSFDKIGFIKNVKEKDFFNTYVNEFKNYLRQYQSIIAQKQNIDELQSYFDFKSEDYSFYNMSIPLFKSKLTDFNENLDNLENYLTCKQCVKNLEELGVLEFLDEFIESGFEMNNMANYFCYLYYNQWMHYIIETTPALMHFSRESHDENIKRFKTADKNKFLIVKEEINQYLAKKVQLANSNYRNERSLLLREANKKRRQKNIRSLVSETGRYIQEVKPCFLMSPLSVSTFLNFDDCKFDAVIFDEASQIFPWDAIGSIARASQIIVVGDPKQMPPTSFFNAGMSDDEIYDEDIDDVVDFESILDLCSASLANVHSLKWHYRSKTEELIAFSNKYFYNGNLITFPSIYSSKNNFHEKSFQKDMGLDYYYVQGGTFNRVSKTNILEAEKVANLVFEHFENYPERSLGVVAFSITQQEAIEKIIEDKRKLNEKFNSFFDEKIPEPFFVKNLETIQGDERDTIIFSVAYAKGSDGKFLHNFGPLNRAGGERRLNVAITRARYNVKLVSSIHSYDINLNNTKAEGSKLLKKYLDCAENGIEQLNNEQKTSINVVPDSDFEQDVREVLEAKGYSVDIQVGCSGYKIDLAVKHPQKDVYVLAVECDGATYHSAKTTRDRDRLRQEILENLGWKFYRIWSTDWFKNRKIEINRLIKAVDQAINKFNIEHDIVMHNSKKAQVENKNLSIEKSNSNFKEKYDVIEADDLE